MSSYIIVREFDKINEEFLKSKIPNYKNEFNDLLAFIENYCVDQENEDVYKFMEINRNRKLGIYVTFKNYVGTIKFSNSFQIEILPKIDLSQNDANYDLTKLIFIKMLKSMNNIISKTFVNADLDIANMSIYEIYISIFLQNVLTLVQNGLKSSYVPNEDNLYFLKGKIDLQKQLTINNIKKYKFYCNYDNFELNTVENRLIKSTLLKLLRFSNDIANKKLCKQLLVYFSMVDESKNYKIDFANVVINRLNIKYKEILQWSNLFLNNMSFVSFSGDERVKALLFPMEKMFEQYVGKFVFNIFSSNNYHILLQDKRYYLFNEPMNKFKLQPDIVAEKDGRIIILDTKWKNLVNDPSKNYNISNSDMYQMYAYAKKYNTSEIILLYPLNLSMKSYVDDNFIYFKSYDNVQVYIYFIDLCNIENSINNLLNNIEFKSI